MICGEGTTVIARPASDVLEFVLDPEKYRRADRKIGRIVSVQRDGNEGTVRHSARLRGLPTPRASLRWRLVPYSKLELRTAPSVMAKLLGRFEGLFTCEERDHGTVVYHRECFYFTGPIRWLLEPYLRTWLERDTSQEVERMRDLLEHGA